MIEETGIVVENKGETVLIRAERTSSCESCAQKSVCHTGGGGDMLIEADNPIGAKKGDYVVFTVGAGSVLKAGILLYLVPVLCFIFGVVLGQAASKRAFPALNADLVSGILGLVFLIIAFIGLKVYGKFVEKDRSYRPHVLRVV